MPRFALEDGRYLRGLEDADAAELHALIDRNRTQLARWMQWAQEQTPGQTLAFIHRSREQESENSGLQRAIVAAQAEELRVRRAVRMPRAANRASTSVAPSWTTHC